MVGVYSPIYRYLGSFGFSGCGHFWRSVLCSGSLERSLGCFCSKDPMGTPNTGNPRAYWNVRILVGIFLNIYYIPEVPTLNPKP